MKIQRFVDAVMLVIILYLLWPAQLLPGDNLLVWSASAAWRLALLVGLFCFCRHHPLITAPVALVKTIYRCCYKLCQWLIEWTCEIELATFIKVATKGADCLQQSSEGREDLKKLFARQYFWLTWLALANFALVLDLGFFIMYCNHLAIMVFLTFWTLLSTIILLALGTGHENFIGYYSKVVIFEAAIVFSCIFTGVSSIFTIVSLWVTTGSTGWWFQSLFNIKLSQYVIPMTPFTISTIIICCFILMFYAQVCNSTHAIFEHLQAIFNGKPSDPPKGSAKIRPKSVTRIKLRTSNQGLT